MDSGDINMSEGLLAPESPLEMEKIESVGTLTAAGAVSSCDVPAWFAERQSAAWNRYSTTATPTRSDQPWRFNSLKVTAIEGYDLPAAVEAEDREELISRSAGLDESSGRMIFGNGELLDRSRVAAELEKQGVLFLPLHRAIREHEELVRKHFMTQPVQLGSEKYAALHESQLKSGTFLYVPKDVSVSLPLEIYHWLGGSGGSTFPHTLLIAERGSSVKLVEFFQSQEADAEGFACGVNDLFIGEGASVRYVSVQKWGRKVRSIQLNSTVVARDGLAVNLGVHLGGFKNRSESVSRLVGEGGKSEMFAVTVAGKDQEFDQRTLQDHVAGRTASDLLYKNALLDNARTIFAGLIKVEPHAHKTDAYQKVRNLMLSDEAEANSMPGLEILADEVRCTHGATSGYIDPAEYFYFLARGIPSDVARRLLVTGFLNEVIERIGDERIAECLSSAVESRFAE